MPNPVVREASIGVYDSGVGGLSVLRALKAKLPGESFIYVADCGRRPFSLHLSTNFLASRSFIPPAGIL
jgi:glutamate racemase